MSKTVCFITRNFGKYDPDSLKGYESIGGFRALRKALTMEGYAIADVLAANAAAAALVSRHGSSGTLPRRSLPVRNMSAATPTRAIPARSWTAL